MKKILSLAMLFVIATSTHAQYNHVYGHAPMPTSLPTAQSGMALGMDLGSATIDFGDTKQVRTNTQTLRFSTHIGAMRMIADFTNHHKKVQDNTEAYARTVVNGVAVITPVAGKATTSARSIGMSAMYDFATDSAISPYVGGRVGYLKAQRNFQSSSANPSYKNKQAVDGLSFGAVAGVNYTMDSFGLHGAVSYDKAGSVAVTGARIGASYNF